MTRKHTRRGSDRKANIVSEILATRCTSPHLKSRAQLREFLSQYFANVPIEDLEGRSTEIMAQIALSHLDFGAVRRKGQAVQVGDPILWIADLERLRVRTNIDQVDLGRVEEGQRVLITSNAFPDRSWSGLVSEVIPHVVVRESRSISSYG